MRQLRAAPPHQAQHGILFMLFMPRTTGLFQSSHLAGSCSAAVTACCRAGAVPCCMPVRCSWHSSALRWACCVTEPLAWCLMMAPTLHSQDVYEDALSV